MSIDQFADDVKYDCLCRPQDLEPEPVLDKDEQVDADAELLESIVNEMEGRPGWEETKQAFDRIIECLKVNGYE